jgi:hypothetical protein
MNPNAPGDAANVAAEIALSHQKVHKAVARKIQDLYDVAGMSDHEIASATGFPLPLIRCVLRGAITTGVSKR